MEASKVGLWDIGIEIPSKLLTVRMNAKKEKSKTLN
jgi:hypothetical protein